MSAKNSIFLDHFSPIFLFGIGISIGIAYTLEHIQENIICKNIRNCITWGSLYFFLFSTIILIVGGLCIYKALISKNTNNAKRVYVILAAYIIFIPFYVFGLYAFSKTYAMVNDNYLEISNKFKLRHDPYVYSGIYQLPFKDMKAVLLIWNLSSMKASVCQSQPYILMKNGERYYIGDFEYMGRISLASFLIQKKKLPIENTTNGLSIKCY